MARRGGNARFKAAASIVIALATLVLGFLKFFEKESRCCLALDACDACPIVAWLPAPLRAKHVEAINECPNAFALAMRYEDSSGRWKDTGWQTIAPRTTGHVLEGSHQPIISYGANYFYAWQSLSSGVSPVAGSSPVKSSMKVQNVYNELGAWFDRTTRIRFQCEQ